MQDLTKEDLRKHSYSYHHNHRISDYDVEKANRLRFLILNSRNADKPMSGDIMICKGPGKTYKDGHIQLEDISYYSAICTQPYIPFVGTSPDIMWKENEAIDIHFSASGGYWFSVPEEMRGTVKYVGKRRKIFKAWGHCGPTADGAFYFEVEVNVWEYFAEDIY